MKYYEVITQNQNASVDPKNEPDSYIFLLRSFLIIRIFISLVW